MQQLEKLCISQSGGYGSFLHMDLKSFIDMDLDLNSPPPMLRKVKLDWMLEKFPGWILKLQNLAKLEVKLMYSKPTDVILKLLKSMPNLMSLKITSFCFDHEDGLEKLHFQNGWFRNLKELCLTNFKNLSYILIDEGALCSLKKLQLLSSMGQLKTLPTGIQHLKKLEVLNIQDVSDEFKRSIAPNEGIEHWIFKQVPFVHLNPPLITKEFVKSLQEYILRYICFYIAFNLKN
jgi:disease resistance protein RPM1